jgi:hypothetical protein
VQFLAILVLTAGTCLAPPAAREDASRCFCVPQLTDSTAVLAFQRERAKIADAVVLIRVTRVYRDSAGAAVADAVVLRAWRGVTSDTVRVLVSEASGVPGTVRVSSCDRQLMLHEEHLLFADRRADGSLQARVCSGSALREEAAPILAELDTLMVAAPEA